jgi:glycine cleavage system H protein
MEHLNSHEWINIEKDIVTVGITAYALKEIGEIVNVELPEIGSMVKAKEDICVLESVKSAIDIYSPVSGKIVDTNKKLEEDISILNGDPENKGWLFKIECMDLKELKELK